MSEAKPLASLSPSLLARKGAARPAMRPQLQPLTFEEQNRMLFGSQARPAEESADLNGHEDLGWNDMGDDVAPVEEAAIPEVLRQIESLAGSLAGTPEKPASARIRRARAVKAAKSSGAEPAPAAETTRQSALSVGRKAAFTLRLDAHRHLRLRLACTLENRSAQAVVTEALDQFLDSMPGLEELARRARRT